MSVKNVWRGLAGLTATLFAFSMVATSVVGTREAKLNAVLGTVSYELKDSGESGIDGTYFASEYSSLEEVVNGQLELAEQISAEGTVLLKNENSALPVASGEKITVWGLNSIWPTLGGMIGSSAEANTDAGQEQYNIITALLARGADVNTDMMGYYYSEAMEGYWRWSGFGSPSHSLAPAFTASWEESGYYSVGEAPASAYSDDILASADGSVAVCVLARDSSEAAEYSDQMAAMKSPSDGPSDDALENGPLNLSNYEKEMIELAKAHSTRVIVVINSDSAMEIKDLADDADVDAILWAGEPGDYGFLGVADVITGIANPSGHLPDTYAADNNSAPAMVNFGLYMYDNYSQGSNPVLTETNKADWYVAETEGIYVGYKYYETRYEDLVLGRGNANSDAGSSTGSSWSYANEVVYPFGYGLSYTTFEQNLISLDVNAGEVGQAQVTVTNTGDVAGKSVAQLYVQVPYTEGGLEKSAIQLVGYAKTQTLEPGAAETLTIEVDPAYFASYDETVTKADGTVGAWVLDAGDYYFTIANGAHEAVNNVLAAKTGAETGLTSINEEAINSANVITWNLGAQDVETYSVNVQNALQDMDINNFIEGTAEYTTRSDWTKGWTAVASIDPTDEMMTGLTNSKYAITENGDGVTWGADNGLSIVDVMVLDEDGNLTGALDLADSTWDSLMDQVTLDEAINFVEYGGDDIEDIGSIGYPRTYMNDGPIGFAYDQVAGYTKGLGAAEGGTYATYSMSVFPTEPVVAATFNHELVEREGELLGEEALWSGESIIIAPGANLHRAAYNARNHEYYSEDSQLTNLMAQDLCTGAESKGLLTQVKHFAFNHQELNRSGISTFMTEQAARENELRCFQGSMSKNITSTIMTAFNRAGTVYAGAHEGLLKQIARNEWGFTGGIVTDMINGADYMNWRDVVLSGGGLALTSSAYVSSEIGTMENAKSEIEKDTTFQQEMKDAIKYWIYVTVQSNAVNGMTPSTEIVSVTPWYKSLCYGLDACFGVLTALFLVLYFRKGKKA